MLDDKLRREIFAIVAKTFGVSTTYLTDLTNAFMKIDGWDLCARYAAYTYRKVIRRQPRKNESERRSESRVSCDPRT